MIRPKLLTSGGDTDIYIGEAEYVTGPGLFYFKVPLSVTRIHACCIGGGAQGAAERNSYQDDWDGGGGGGLGWANNIEVTPGEELVVQVGGTVGRNGTNVNDGDSWISRGLSSSGGPEEILVAGNAPGNVISGFFGRGGTYQGDGGGNGGGGCSLTTYDGYVKQKGSGGGAGGYRGDGGGGSIYGGNNSGNGGAGSGGVSGNRDRPGSSSNGSRGGGVGIRGQGASGAAPRPDAVDYWSNANQQPGLPGSGGDKMEFGAGGAGEKDGWDQSENTQAGHGAVRIIWGNRFSYPDNADVEAE